MLTALTVRAELTSQIRKSKMRTFVDDSVIDRLRTSYAPMNAERYEIGFLHGEAWAKEDAEAAQLETMEECKPVWQLTAQDIYVMVDPESHRFPNCADVFWRDVVGEDDLPLTRYKAFLRGFMSGALSVWKAVKPQL